MNIIDKNQKIFIILPTYNEKENISRLIKELFELNLPPLNILVVDDNSPDGTGKIVEDLKARYNNLDILHRQKKMGLGRAYIDAFRIVLAKGADIIIHMDVDFSHDPKYLKDLLTKIQDYDLVLGSRYVKGGGIANWNHLRRLISRLGNLYAQLVLNLPVKDLTGGFKCYRRHALESINLDELSSIGFSFMIETTYKTYQRGFVIKEIPIIFTERRLGKSKFNLKIIFESFFKVLALRFRK